MFINIFHISGPERSEGNQTQFPPLNPEVRGMSGPEPPPTEARFTTGLLSDIFEKSKFRCFPELPAYASPRRLRPL